MIITLFIICLLGLIFSVYFFFRGETNTEKKNRIKLKKSIDEGHVIDPETGKKMSVEFSESGYWKVNDTKKYYVDNIENKSLTNSKEDYEELALHYLRQNKAYKKKELTDDQINFLENTTILSNYDDWSYLNSFLYTKYNAVIFSPKIELKEFRYQQFDYLESQLMCWVKINDNGGHLYFRQKTFFEKILDKINSGNYLEIPGYRSFIFKKPNNEVEIVQILKNFTEEKKLEIEIIKDNLFIKTFKPINLKDIKRIEKIINNVCQQYICDHS